MSRSIHEQKIPAAGAYRIKSIQEQELPGARAPKSKSIQTVSGIPPFPARGRPGQRGAR